MVYIKKYIIYVIYLNLKVQHLIIWEEQREWEIGFILVYYWIFIYIYANDELVVRIIGCM